MALEIEVAKNEFKKIKRMNNYEFNNLLRYKLKDTLLDIESRKEEAIEEKIKEVRARMTKMVEELTRLTEFYEKAVKDKEIVEKWLFKIDDENAELLERIKNGNHNKIRSN